MLLSNSVPCAAATANCNEFAGDWPVLRFCFNRCHCVVACVPSVYTYYISCLGERPGGVSKALFLGLRLYTGRGGGQRDFHEAVDTTKRQDDVRGAARANGRCLCRSPEDRRRSPKSGATSQIRTQNDCGCASVVMYNSRCTYHKYTLYGSCLLY